MGTDISGITSEAEALLVRHPWQGNVRELENTLEHAVVMTRGDTIEPAALPERLTRRRRESLVAERTPTSPTLEAIERAYIMWVLTAEGGNKTRAAEALGIDPSTLYRKLSRYEGQNGG
jgi:two-component system response regulator HydG